MSQDAFWQACDQISHQGKRRKKEFQSTDELLSDITSDSSENVDPTKSAMKRRYNDIYNEMRNTNNVNSNSNNHPSTSSNDSSLNSTFVLINDSDLNSRSGSSVPSVDNVRPCCDNPDIYHKHTLSPSEREAIISFKSDGIYPTDRKTSQQKQSFKNYCKRFEVRAVSANGNADVVITRLKTQYKLNADNSVISKKKTSQLQDTEWRLEQHTLTVPKCGDVLDIFINNHAVGHPKINIMQNKLHNK